MATEGASASSSASESSEKSEAIKKASELLAQGKRNMVCGEVPKAVGLYEEAVQLLVTSCGELSRDCADAYFNCGSALLELGRMETSVLGAALEGVDVEEEKEEDANEQFEKPLENDSIERLELRKEVYKAMAEGDREEETSSVGKSSQTLPVKEDTQSDGTEVDKTKTDEPSEGSKLKTVDVSPHHVSHERMEDEESPVTAVASKGGQVKSGSSEPDKESSAASKEVESGSSEPGKESTAASKEEKVESVSSEPGKESTSASKEEKVESGSSEPGKESTAASKEVESGSSEPGKESTAASKEVESGSSEPGKESTAASKEVERGSSEPGKESTAASGREVESGLSEPGKESANIVDNQTDDGKAGIGEDLPDEKLSSNDEKPQESKIDQEPEMEITNTEEEKDTDADKDGEVAEDAEEEEEGEENTVEDKESQEGEEIEGEEKEEDVPNFQLSWEYLDLAKVIYLKSDTAEEQLKAAECYIRLGELSMETEQHATAAEDLENALKIQQKFLTADDRLIAETHYQLGLAYGLGKEFELAIKHYTAAIGVIEAKIASLSKLVEEAAADKEDKEKPESEQVKKYQDEIKELQELIPEMRNKIEDSKEEAKDMEKMKDMAKEILGFTGSSKKFDSPKKSEPLAKDKSAEVDENGQRKATDIAHLVRKKRKPDNDDLQVPNGQETKKIRQDDSSTEASTADLKTSSGMDVSESDAKLTAEQNKTETAAATAEPVAC